MNVHSGPIIAQSVQRCGLISTICRFDNRVSTNTHRERLTEVGNLIIILNFQNLIYFHIWWLPIIPILAMPTCPYLAILTSGSRTTADLDHHGYRWKEKNSRKGNSAKYRQLWVVTWSVVINQHNLLELLLLCFFFKRFCPDTANVGDPH